MTTGEQGSKPRLTFYTKSDCALCHEAKATLLVLQRELAFEIEEIDITTEVGTYAEFCEAIPVGYLDSRKLFKYESILPCYDGSYSADVGGSSVAGFPPCDRDPGGGRC